ncbi:cytochrome b/b6 domain-containing protein [Leisingera sp.]|uniref:cytochrome b/b6 domain-containing protein n=1 Tax=Leisingera sp. TaxID=1879318 RepID=UPI002B26E156|nr:cytochrome b/b6 domain-containing protein [Leisingera sp.]
MKLEDTGLHFGLVTVIMHWVGAACILSFATGVLWEAITEANEIRNATLHIGALTACLHLFRLIWRLRNYHPAPLGGANPAQVLVGRGVALGMLLAGIVLPMMFWFKECDAIASPIGQTWWYASLFWMGFTCCLLGLLLHLFGVYTHVCKFKDDSLKRMVGITTEL